MRLQTLYEKPAEKVNYLLTIIGFVAAVGFSIVMAPIEEYLTTNSPYGVLDLEFMLTSSQAAAILTAWGSIGIEKEIFVTYVDMGFLVSYSTFIAFLNLMIIRSCVKKSIFVQTQNFPLIVGFAFPYIAALFDFIENINLLIVLQNPTSFSSFNPLLATIFATMKFGLLIISILFSLFLLIRRLIPKSS